MAKVTLIWVARNGRPFSVLSIPKSLIFIAAGIVCVAVFSSVAMFFITRSSNEKRLAVTEENLRLREAIVEKEQQNQGQARVLAEKGESLDTLEQQLREIRTFESKIRQFLGLDGKGTNPKHPNQGGGVSMRLGFSLSGMSSNLKEQTRSIGPDIQSRTQPLRASLLELMNYVQQKQAETNILPTTLPVASSDVWISSGFGWRSNPYTGRGSEFHAGLDIAGALLTPIKAPADGEVTETGENKLLGRFARIRHTKTLSTLYGHMNSVAVKEGQTIKRDDVIGYMGSTGRTTGIHLHYSVIKDGNYVDPVDYILDCDVSSLTLGHKTNEASKILF